MTATHTRSFDLQTLLPGPYRCAECASRLCTQASRLPGVLESSCDEETSALAVAYDSRLVSAADLAAAVERLAVEVTGGVEHAAYRVTGLD